MTKADRELLAAAPKASAAATLEAYRLAKRIKRLKSDREFVATYGPHWTGIDGKLDELANPYWLHSRDLICMIDQFPDQRDWKGRTIGDIRHDAIGRAYEAQKAERAAKRAK